jgi:phytol kinase
MVGDMLRTLFVVLVTFFILVYAEWLARAKQIHAELTRKLVHITIGTFVAFWPFFLSWNEIEFLSLAFLIVVSISIKFDVFRSIHAVKRNAMGELLFAVVIGLLAYSITSPWVFAAAMLNLSLADGFAAIVGLGWGEGNSYKVFGHTKSIAGTLAFFVTSLIIMIVYSVFSHLGPSILTIILLPAVAAAVENVSVQGMDNIVIPLLVALVLTSAV